MTNRICKPKIVSTKECPCSHQNWGKNKPLRRTQSLKRLSTSFRSPFHIPLSGCARNGHLMPGCCSSRVWEGLFSREPNSRSAWCWLLQMYRIDVEECCKSLGSLCCRASAANPAGSKFQVHLTLRGCIP